MTAADALKYFRIKALCGLALCALAFSQPAFADGWRFDGIDRVIAVSDVHGAYDAFVRTLQNAGVLDAELAWAAKDTHLVITGDLMDRGPDSRPVMDLLMRLEGEAGAAGGQVHVLLGNHEVMNLVGDLRYVSAGEYAAFRDDESAELRDRWFTLYRQSHSNGDEAGLRAKFDDGRPAGFFAHRAAFAPDGEYGRWLLGKPLLVVINDTAYVHGGLSPRVAEMGLDGVNGLMKNEVGEYARAMNMLMAAGLLDPVVNFYDHAEVLAAIPPSDDRSPELVAAIETVTRLSDAAIHQLDSPLWYRGNVGCPAPIEIDRLQPVLDRIGADRVVIGHTPTVGRQVLSRFNGRVVEIDTGMLSDYYHGSGNALLVEGDRLQVIRERGAGPLAVADHPRRVGLRDEDISAEDIESIMASGQVLESETVAGDVRRVKLAGPEGSVHALFRPNPRDRGFVPELAAYRLDRHLELDMVPVTVSRQIDGQDGTLQFIPAATMTEALRVERRRGSSAWCPLPEQWNAMYVFDVLIHNAGRSQDQIIYSQESWQLMLSGHDRAFEASRSRPPYLGSVELVIGSVWQDKLRSLDESLIEELLGDVLDRRRLRALEQRRDGLLKDAGAGR
ncbi:MAG: metallophosphoesterase [Gammaproteobacteria bacterium]|nr:metallophosphoesterase [Gammaproteobacteria bacterium]MDH4255798.1 metallophosphoesterase [Gammaproteobacteria bacterium]MDH5309241.1 metallophosphoesterase [Gammaproteobacteria bacterium]